MDSALDKMPKYEGDLIRTVYFTDWPDCDERTADFVKEFILGKNIQIRQYWSTSKNEGYDEAEVLYERNAMFVVIAKVLDKGIRNILLWET